MNKKTILVISGLIVLFAANSRAGYGFSLKNVFSDKQYEDLVKLKEEEAKKLVSVIEEKQNECQALVQKNETLQEMLKELQNKNQALAGDYDKLKLDRDNLLAQSKKLLEEKDKLVQKEDGYKKLDEEQQAWLKEKESLKNNNAALVDNLEKLKTHLAGLTQEKIRLEKFLVQLKTEYELNITRLKEEATPQSEEMKNRMNNLKKENIELTKQLRQLQKDGKVSEGEKNQAAQKAGILEAQLEELEKKYADLQKENRMLAQESSELPKKIADLARQNKRLIDQTADLHYNTGVFYVKNKEYKQAVKEFEKVLEVKPMDAQASYNLGYIYAKPLLDREKAIKYFKNYLTYAPDAQDAEWVRKYIYTWQTWYGKDPFE